jgi:hypothetical protein
MPHSTDKARISRGTKLKGDKKFHLESSFVFGFLSLNNDNNNKERKKKEKPSVLRENKRPMIVTIFVRRERDEREKNRKDFLIPYWPQQGC